MVDNMKIEDEQSCHEDSHLTKTVTDMIRVFQESLHLQQHQQPLPSGPHHHHHHHQKQQQMQQQNSTDAFFPMFPEVSPLLSPWTLPHHQVHGFNPVQYPLTNPIRDHHHHHDPFLHLPPPPSSYGGLFNTAPFGLQAELQKMTAQEIMDAKALAASKSHSEAERRRRERINNHLAKLRSLLPNTTKTDKASLLAEVIQHVKELKRQTSMIAETTQIPTEVDELTVDNAGDEDGKFVVRASLCCEDRPDLLPDLIKTLKSLRLRTLKAEITTLGGRVKNVLFITSEDDDTNSNTDNVDPDEQPQQHPRQQNYSLSSIHEALKAVMEKSNGDESGSGNVKRQRTNNNINILEHRSL